MLEIDDAHSALSGVIERYGHLSLADANEAETRIKVIDEMLRSVLGWTLDDIRVEERTSEDGTTTFADYLICVASCSLVVEAKRAGASFLLPSGRQSLKLGGVLSAGEVGEAIRQARDYCRRLNSVPFAIATNGSAWVLFPAVRQDRVSFEDSYARVFVSLQDIKERFVEFWELLSRQRVMDGNLENALLGSGRTEQTTRRLLSLLRDYGFKVGRNSVFEHIEPAVNAALTDEGLLENPHALAACYVKNSERTKYDSRLQMYLRDTKPTLDHTSSRIRSKKHLTAFDEKLAHVTPSQQPRFIMLLGPVGAGKTTFLHHTRFVSAANLADKMLWLYVDFKRATTSDDPRAFIYGALLQFIDDDQVFQLGDWEKSIKPAYRHYIENLKRGPLQPLAKSKPEEFDAIVSKDILEQRSRIEPYAEAILRHALAKHPGFLIIDNVDQILDDAFQQRIFVEAQAIARRIGLNVVMSMRDATYLRNRNSPAFDAFQFDSFYVDPPPVRPVLSRRFAYAKEVLRGKEADIRTDSGIHVKVKDLSVFFEIVSKSVLDDEAGYMIDVLSGGDIRRGVDLVREFLASAHTTADKALANFLSDGEFKFPKHEVFKGAILGQRKFYREEESLLPNILDAKLDSHWQLLRFHLVGALVQSATDAAYESTAIEQLMADMSRLGICETESLGTLRTLWAAHIIRTADGADLGTHSKIVPTRLAGYLIKSLCGEFSYFEACLLDSSIRDDGAWQRMAALTQEIDATRDIFVRTQKRIARAREYLEYLKVREDSWIVEGKRRNMPNGWTRAWVKDTVAPAIERDLERVGKSAEKRYAQKNRH